LLRRKALERASSTGETAPPPGCVHLVGTGPGSPELLTLAALRLLQTADVVLYDRLVSPEVLGALRQPVRLAGGSRGAAELCSPSATLVYVGKAAGYHTRSQEEIHELLQARTPPPTPSPSPSHAPQQFAGAGARVLRLKGGDPLIFGRGGEEAAFLRARGVPVSVSPGVTAAAGIAAELGVPLTHRGVASSVRFLTGHSREGGAASELDADSFGPADRNCTLVLYMALATLPSLAQQLLQAGLSESTPALAVERGTTERQRRVWARLAGLASATAQAGLRSPTLVLVGRCCALSPLWPWSAAEAQAEAAGVDVGAFVLQEGAPEGAGGAGRLWLPGGGEVTMPRARRGLFEPPRELRKEGAASAMPRDQWNNECC
jgi:siroheme synthase